MYKQKDYRDTVFSATVLREAHEKFLCCLDQDDQEQVSYHLDVQSGETEWGHDSMEEFLSDYRNPFWKAYLSVFTNISSHRLTVLVLRASQSIVTVAHPERSKIESVFEVFEKNLDDSKLPPAPLDSSPQRPTIFIGHGRSPLWRDLKDHLQDQHGFDVVAYEMGARAGHAIRDILEEMLDEGTLAILVMTGEDATRDELLIPRLNVVHELGLFQGRLGFSKAIVLLEEGTQEISNIHGTHQIRFTKGNIKETFGDVLATLGREFPGGGK